MVKEGSVMKKLLSGLESELKWIDNHPEFYDNSQHQEAVKKAIVYRYRIQSMIQNLNKVLPT